MAEMLSRAGLHLGSTTIGRILKESPHPAPIVTVSETGHVVTAKRVNHVWHIDLTAIPISSGFWASWLPFSLPQCWPFCWWLAVVIDHYLWRAMGIAIFSRTLTSSSICAFVERAIIEAKETPKYIICDKGKIFCCETFKKWCKNKTIGIRFGAVGKHGSIAVNERFIKTMKDELTHRILVSYCYSTFCGKLKIYLAWYNEHRPHTTLHGRTPHEAYFSLRAANHRPRIEPRKRWPRLSPCATPRTLIAGQPGDRFTIHVNYLDRERHLPIVSLKRAA